MAATVVPSVSGDDFPLVVPDNMAIEDFLILVVILVIMAFIAAIAVSRE